MRRHTNSLGEHTALLDNGCLSPLDAAERHSESENPAVFDKRGTSDSTEEFQSHLEFIPETPDYRQEACAYVPVRHTHIRYSLRAQGKLESLLKLECRG